MMNPPAVDSRYDNQSAKADKADPAKGPACPQLRMLSAGDFEFNSPVPGSPLWGIV